MNTIRKRLLSLFLCFVLIAGMLPVGAFANETGEAATPEFTEVTETLTQTASETEELSVSTETSEEESEQTDVSKKDETEAEKAEKKEEKAAEKEAKQEEKAAAKAAEASTDPSSEATEPSSEATEPSTEATEPEVIAVTGITLDQTALEVGVGELPMTLTATVLPEDATDKTVTWESSEPGVVSVENGVLTFGYMGEAVITATAGGFSASCTVKVGEGEAAWYDGPDYLDAAIFCSDVHGSTSDLTSVLGGVAKSGVAYSSIGFVGDTCLTVANTTSIVQSALGDTDIDVMFSYASSHDTENGADISTNWNYSGEVEGVSDYYLVYTIREDDMKSDTGADDAFTTWYNGLTDAEKKLPIFIMSHRPLHDHRDDNAGAATWYNAISAAAESSDIVFFWGHNHTSEGSVDTAAYYVAKDGTETFTVYQGDTVAPNFTYMNAGYINANNQRPKRIGVATTVRITGDSLIFQDYTTSGEYTNSSYSHNVTVAREFASTDSGETTPTEQTFYSAESSWWAAVTATATGATFTAVEDDAKADELLSYWYGYDISLEGQVEDTTATVMLWLDPDAMFSSDLAVYYYNETTGAYEAVTGYTVDTDEYNVEYITISNAALGTYVYGTPNTDDIIPDGATLTRLDITGPEKTKYFLSEDLENGNVYLDITGLTVAAVYTLNGAEYTKTLDWNQFDETVDGYALSFDDLTTKGEKTVKVTYGDVSGTFTVWVCEDEVVADDVTVSFDTESVIALTVKTVEATETITTAVADVITGDVTVYSFTPTYANGDTALTGKATVTLPIPEGVTNPAVYYVSDDGATVENMNAVKTEDGKSVTFTTTHFSTYVVGEGTGTNIEVPDPETATGSGSTTTTEEKEVYVLVSAPTAGKQYIIVNRNTAGSGYALKENTTTGSPITVNAAGNGISAPYIETTDETIMWNTASGMTFQSENGGYYLRYNDSLTFSTRSSTDWTYSSNRLYYNYYNYRQYYLRYNSGWSASTTQSNVYLYEKQTVNVETTTDVSGTYSIAGNPAEVTKVVTNGSTATLGSTLTFTPDSGSATTTDTSATATYTVVENGDPNGVISDISGNTVTFTGVYGKALVKVSKEVSFGSETKTVTNYIIVNASEPTYVLDITDGGNVVTGTTISKKNVTASTTLQLGTQIQFVDEDGAEIAELPEGATIEWHIPEEYHGVATVDHETGLVSFKGVNGAFYVTATLTVNGKDYTVGVNISAATTSYSVPSDGVEDFPEYPNEGAIRFDKTATAVGNFSETGIAQVELSMTGVPYTTGSEIDVVLMLDMTGSMDDVTSSTSEPTGYVRVDASIAASKAFIETIVTNEDGSYNGNRVGVYVFNKNGAATLYDFGSVDSDTELEAIYADLDSIYDDHYASGGTPYDDGLAKCQEVLAAAKTDGIGNNRQQFTVFMTDGVPTSYAYVNGSSYGTHSSASAIAGMLTSSDDYATRDTDYKYEYYSTEMKKAGVTVYTVGVGLENTNNAWSGSATQCLNLASVLLNDISGPGGETTQPDGVGASTLSKKDNYFFSVEDATAGTDMEKVFSNIAQKILQAATNVTVEDQIGDNYTMIFDIPTTTTANGPEIDGVTNDFYIEFGKYALDEDHERTTFTSVTKVYLENTNGTLSAKDAADPVFEQKTIGDKGSLYYWSTNAADGDAGISVEVDGTTYYFVSYGMEKAGYNMTSGAYANGTVEDTNMSENLVIATPYFVYNAGTKMLYWTVDKLDTEEYALRYFVYLNNSATEVGTAKETDPGSYLTNDHAYITYTNFNGNECRQEFDKPQMTWSGAQVSYVFYLVNAQGQPINKSGQVVDFANATFITDVYTESTVWNKGEDGKITADSQLSIDWLAKELLPSDYLVYDMNANYQLHVYGDHTGESIFDYFTIDGNEASDISSSLNERLKLSTTANTVSLETTKVYNTKAGTKYDDYGTYTSKATDSINGETVLTNFDFYNTTVAFAVVWQPRLVEDAVVVDYGLDVLINVVQNDILQNSVSGIGLGKDAYDNENVAMNTGVTQTSKLGTAALDIDGNTISIENETAVRFHQNDMEFDKPVVFYYETPVEFWEGSDPTEGFMYSSVTVIPATTVYYEDDFLTYTDSSKATETCGVWTTVGTSISATQSQDRPGKSQISATLDADNNYGYDAAYSSMSEYSMGSAKKVTVTSGISGMASFDFYGTGFDVISMTDTTTGSIIVRVFNENNETVWDSAVDTYYGYRYQNVKIVYTYDGTKWNSVATDIEPNEISQSQACPVNPVAGDTYTIYTIDWRTVDSNDPNALYQVPVIKVSGLTYGKYTAKIVASYADILNNRDDDSYDFYLDAIRIYDPTGNENKVANKAYTDDGEGWPTYFEVRNKIISKETFNSLNDESVSGIVFIDGTLTGASNTANVSDYVSYGPNNETYLSAGQAIAFELNAGAASGSVAKVQLAVKTVGGNASVKVYSSDGTTALDADISTATDMYYDITALNGKTVIIVNDGESGILSITNVKVTYTEAQPEASDPAPAMFMLRRSSVDEALATLNAEEEEIPETTVPDESVPETTIPEETESEETEPEVTEPEATEPEASEPSETPTTEEVVQAITNAVKDVVNKVVNALSNLFGRWFR